MSRKLAVGTMAAYSAPMVPIWMLHTPALSILPGLYATLGGIDLMTIGAILAFSRFLDGFTDPLVGWLSDNTRTRFGKRKPWILAGSLLCLVGVWFWFRPGPDTGAVYFLLASAAVYLGWTMVEIPHAAWLSELTHGYNQRSRLSATRTTGIYLGHCVFWLGPFLPMLATREITPEVMRIQSWVIIGLLLVSVTWMLSRVPIGYSGSRSSPSIKRAAVAMGKNGPAKLLAAILLVSWFASGMVAGLYFFYISEYLQLGDKFGHIGLSVAVIGFLSASAWGWVATRVGKHRVIAICNFSTVLTLLAMAMLEPGTSAFYPLLLIFSFSALFGAGSTVGYYALMSDVVDYDELKTGAHQAGSYYALITLLQKLGLGAGAGSALILAALFGFDQNGNNEGQALIGFFVAFLGIPIVLNLVATFLVFNFPLDERRHRVIRKRLDSLARRRTVAAHG